MSILYDCSPFKIKKKDTSFILSSLKEFSKSPLAQFSKQDLSLAKKKWNSIKKAHNPIFIFAFGGAGASAKILNSLFPLKNKQNLLIDTISDDFLNHISSLKKTELKTCHFIFISKSGRTKEALFYKSFLKKIYSAKQLSLKNRVTLLTQSLKSPLLKWAQKECCPIMMSNSPLPGRFSFFTLNGLLQSQAYDCYLEINPHKNSSKTIKVLEFFLHHCKKRKEIFVCPFDFQLKALSQWLEMSWSESLFKASAAQYPPLIRNTSLSSLRHACIEELVTKKDSVCFLGINLKSKNKSNLLYKKQIKELLKVKKIPYIFIELSLKNKNSPSELIVTFYKILFCMGRFFKSNIYTQPWVDYLKNI